MRNEQMQEILDTVNETLAAVYPALEAVSISALETKERELSNVQMGIMHAFLKVGAELGIVVDLDRESFLAYADEVFAAALEHQEDEPEPTEREFEGPKN